MKQFNDVLRTLINDTNRFENRFGMIRDEEGMLAVGYLMPESLLNYRFRGTTMSYSELLIAVENIIVDKDVTVPTARNKKVDTSGPMEIGLAAKGDDESAREEGDQIVVNLALQAVYTGSGKGKWGLGEGQSWNGKGHHGGKGGNDGGKSPWQKGNGKKGGKRQEKGVKGEARACWTCGKTGHIAASCRKGGNRNLYAIEEEDNEYAEETID